MEPDDRSVEKHKALEVLAKSKNDKTGVKYVPVFEDWWATWKRWAKGESQSRAGPLFVASQKDVLPEDITWIPVELFEFLLVRYPSADFEQIAQYSPGIRRHASRWTFSWDFGMENSCWCCGEPDARQRCSGCRMALYCDENCQSIHWRHGHSLVCENVLDDVVLASRSNNNEIKKVPKGLENLGNSCFMNATVQCLVAIHPLLKYFLREEWRLDLRKNHRGVATVFSNLCKELFFGGYRYVNPSQLKEAISKLSTGIFAGYQQQDAEEMLLLLLDTFHEDLNVVDEKIPPPGEEEDQYFYHRRKEHSIIDSLTLGSYETRTTCSRCGHASVKTDVFKHLNLALPPNSPDRVIVVVVVRQAMHANLKNLPQQALQTRYAVVVSKSGQCMKFQQEVAAASRVPLERLLFVSVEHGTLTREIHPSLAVKQIPVPSLSGDVMVVAYELASTAPTVEEQKRIESTKKDSGDVETKNDEDDVRHLICMFSRGKRLERIIPLCVPFSASKDTVCSVVTKLKGAVARLTKYADLKFFPSSADGHFRDDGLPLDPNNNSQLFADVLGEMGRDVRSGRLRIAFVVCARPMSTNPLRIEFKDHDSCTRLKARLAEEMKGESVMSCLQHFVQPTTLEEDNGWRCSKCNIAVEAEQKASFTRLPEVLILVLKRFNFLEGKIESLVRFDTQGMDLSDFLRNAKEDSQVYDLFAVVNHYGSMVGGHYTAFIARDIGDSKPATRWDEIDDSRHMELNEKSVVSHAAYILFYRKRSVG